MPVKDREVFNVVRRLGDHYRNNISNRYTRKALQALELDQETWGRIEQITSEEDYQQYQGYRFDDLYDHILALARFVFRCRIDLLPNIRSILAGGLDAGSRDAAADRVLRDMVANNFRANLSVLSDMVNELYIKTVELDKQSHEVKPPVYRRIPELRELGRYLILE
jgi:hypothetical protein